MTTSVETFSETAALFALMEGRKDDAARIVADMLPTERADYAGLLTRMRTILGEPCGDCGRPTPAVESVTLRPLGPDREYLCVPCAEVRRHPTSRAWLLWSPDGTLADITEYEQPVTLAHAQQRHDADADLPAGTLEPVPETALPAVKAAWQQAIDQGRTITRDDLKGILS